MVEIYKIMNHVEEVHKDLQFTISHNTRSRRHTRAVLGNRFKTTKKKFFFTLHVIHLWNACLSETRNLTMFKKH